MVFEKKSRDKSTAEYVAQLEEAGILFSYSLFDDMFSEDTEIEKLKHLPGIKEVIDGYKSQFKALSDDYIRDAMEKYVTKKREIEFFSKAVQDVRTVDDSDCAQLIDGFTQSKKTAFELLHDASGKEKQTVVQKLNEELDKVCDELMSIEIREVGKYEVLVDDFDNKITEMKVRMQMSVFSCFTSYIHSSSILSDSMLSILSGV